MARSSLASKSYYAWLVQLAERPDYEAMIFRFKNEFAKDDVLMAQVDAFNPDGSMSRGKSRWRH
jgi:FAD/FMN-containing dehydrogenase